MGASCGHCGDERPVPPGSEQPLVDQTGVLPVVKKAHFKSDDSVEEVWETTNADIIQDEDGNVKTPPALRRPARRPTPKVVTQKDLTDCFRVLLEKDETSLSKFGVDCKEVDETILEVVRIADVGIVAEWNRTNPAAQVQVGDHILAVNGLTGRSRPLLQRIIMDHHLELLVRRGNVEATESQ